MAAAYTKALETNNTSGLGLPQHEYMANLVEDMATSLSAYGNQNGYNLPFSYYNNMAWGGLTHYIENDIQIEYDFFKKAVPNDNDRMTIVNTIASEQNNNNNTFYDGNGNKISPKGKPCN
jgi:hypothetical protein